MTESEPHAELIRTIEASLERAAELGGQAALGRFRPAVETALTFGPSTAAQHLRNLLLAHASARGLARQPPAGLTAAHMPRVSAIVDALDTALLAALSGNGAAAARSGRVLIVLDHLPGEGRIYSHTRQVCAYAAALALDPAVERIGILATQETAPENPFEGVEVAAADHPGWRQELAAIDPGALAKTDFFTPARQGPVRPYAASLAWARAFAAAVAIAPQGVFRSRLLPALLARSAAMVALQMNATNPEPEWADLVLAHGDGADATLRTTPAKWRDHPVPMIPFPPLESTATAAKRAGEEVVVATVLTQGRLERGLLKDRAADLELVLAFLHDHPAAVWRLIGLDDSDRLAARIAEHSAEGGDPVGHRVRLIGVVPDLAAEFTDCDLYVHTPALGGGAMGAAMAITAGAPVLARGGGDIANLLPPGHAYRDATQARARLWRLASDGELRQRWLLAQRRTLARDHSIAATSLALRGLFAQARTAGREGAQD